MHCDIKTEESIQEPVNTSHEELFFERFKTLLDNAGLSQSQLGEKIGQCKQYIWTIAHLKQIPPERIRIRIAQALNTDTCIIWKNEEIENGRNK